MALNDALDIGQPDARALELLLAVQALKHAEQLAGIPLIKPRPVVANEDRRFAVSIGSTTDFDFGLGATAGDVGLGCVERVGHWLPLVAGSGRLRC